MALVEENIYTVSQINSSVSSLIEKSYPEVAVLGELSNFKRHTSGHLYMTLKDESAQLRTVCFRSDAERIEFELVDGMKIVARGRLTIYEPYGQYQLVARSLEPAGAGELELAFRALCEKLRKEGLFDEEHKKELPRYPFRIAVITSPTGAAVRDIVSTIKRRWPCAEVLLLPVHVQGEQAAPEIVRALASLERIGDIDVAIVGRGGGSIEDLWAFNEESVARAIFACSVPTISAVGHETDVTIADFVADVRAATPTMAAEIAVPLVGEVEDRLRILVGRIAALVESRIRLHSMHLQKLLTSYGMGRIMGQIERSLQRLDFTMDKLLNVVSGRLDREGSRLKEKLAALNSLSPLGVLARGYAICTHPATGRTISSVGAALEAGEMGVTFRDGRIRARVEEREDG